MPESTERVMPLMGAPERSLNGAAEARRPNKARMRILTPKNILLFDLLGKNQLKSAMAT